jgi:hypothetical protein
MTETQLKYAIGISMICANLFVLLEIVTLYFLHGFDFDQFGTLLGIVLPMFSGYTASIVAFFISDRTSALDNSEKVTTTYAVLTAVFPLLFVLLISFAILVQSLNRVFSNFSEFRGFLTLIESAFATYLGMLIYSLFKELRGTPKKTSAARRKD